MQIGLSYAELKGILMELGKPGEVSSPEKVADTVAKAIDANNKKLLDDINKLLR